MSRFARIGGSISFCCNISLLKRVAAAWGQRMVFQLVIKVTNEHKRIVFLFTVSTLGSTFGNNFGLCRVVALYLALKSIFNSHFGHQTQYLSFKML